MEDQCAVAESTAGSGGEEDRPRSNDWMVRVRGADAKRRKAQAKQRGESPLHQFSQEH